MFKRLAFIICGLVYASLASAQESQEKMLMTQAPCAPFPEMAQLAERHGEEPLFMGTGLTFKPVSGESYRGGMIFAVNQDTGTWTMFQVFGDGMTCMLMNGNKFQPYYGGQ